MLREIRDMPRNAVDRTRELTELRFAHRAVFGNPLRAKGASEGLDRSYTAETRPSELSDNLSDSVLLYLAVRESCIDERQHGGQRCKQEAPTSPPFCCSKPSRSRQRVCASESVSRYHEG